jgi:GTP-binding protein HflX
VIDVSNPRFEDQIRSVETIIGDLHLEHKACLRVFNKRDLLPPEVVDNLARLHDAVAVSAVNASTLFPLIGRMQAVIEEIQTRQPEPAPVPEEDSVESRRDEFPTRPRTPSPP